MANIKGLLHFFRKDFNMTFCHWHSIWTININRRYNNLLHKFVAAKQQQSNVGLPVIFITFIKIKILYEDHAYVVLYFFPTNNDRNISTCDSHFIFSFLV